jgi:hypothetical protein
MGSKAMIFGKLANTSVDEVHDLSTSDLLALVRNYEDGQEFNPEIMQRVYEELADRHLYCLYN